MAGESPRSIGERSRLAIAFAGLVLVSLACCFIIYFRSTCSKVDFTSWKIPSSNIEYVGSAACLECHAVEAKSYSETAMARSIVELAKEAGPAPFNDRVELPKSFPFQYSVKRDIGISVEELSLDPQGNAVCRQTEKLTMAIGSGAHATTFAVARPGVSFFEAPLTWYRSLSAWAMSPGYERADHRRFNREITAECLFCHAGQVNHVTGSRNRFDADRPIVEAAIGCERCHGPGDEHVRAQRGNAAVGKSLSATLVDPGKLDFELGNDVCLQCHRTGNKGREVLRPGRSWTDFRPGMPLANIAQQFADSDDSTTHSTEAGIHFTGKMSQLSRSRCFVESPGKLGCLSCHSIHHRPEPQKRVEAYRKVCLDCHQSHPCKLSEPVRRRRQTDDSCHACHMPKVRPSDVVHTTITDHRIRRPSNDQPGASPAATATSRRAPLVAVGGNLPDASEQKRNLGLAYANRGAETGSRTDFERAVSLLEECRADFADDAEHRLNLGLSNAMLGKNRAAVSLLKEAVRIDDRLEVAHNALATAALLTNDNKLARTHIERSLQINPYKIDMLIYLANMDMSTGDLVGAESSYRRVLAVDAGNRDARLGLQRIAHKPPSTAPSQNRQPDTDQRAKPARKS